MDDGIYKAESISTQAIRPEEVGCFKAASTASVLKAIHPGAEVRHYYKPVEALDADAFYDRDVVFLATDNLRAEMDVSSRCVRHGVPLLQGAVYGDLLVAQVSLWRHRQEDDACLVCHFGAEEFRHLSAETRWSCSGALDGDVSSTRSAPTMSVPGLSSLAANLAMMVMLRLVLEAGDPLEDALFEYCAYSNQIVTSPLRRNPACPADHRRWERATISSLANRTLREIAGAADMSDTALSIELDGHAFSTEAICDCSHRTSMRVFTAAPTTVGRCDRCEKALRIDPFGRSAVASMTALQPVLDRPVRDIGAPHVRGAIVRSVSREVLVVDESANHAACSRLRSEQP